MFLKLFLVKVIFVIYYSLHKNRVICQDRCVSSEENIETIISIESNKFEELVYTSHHVCYLNTCVSRYLLHLISDGLVRPLSDVTQQISLIWYYEVAFSSTDSVMTLKLVEAGIPKERLGLMAIPLIPIQLVMPLIIVKYTRGPRPLDIFLKAIPYRLLFGFVAAFLVWVTPKLVPDASEGLPFLYVVFLIICYALHQVCVYCMFVSIMAFFAKISDSSVGGTYMTLLNTVMNLGGNWPAILALYFVDPLTWRQCEGGTESLDNACRDNVEKEHCISQGGKCIITLDGYYIETVICTVIGILWLAWGSKKIRQIQSLDEKAWKLNRRNKENKEKL